MLGDGAPSGAHTSSSKPSRNSVDLGSHFPNSVAAPEQMFPGQLLSNCLQPRTALLPTGTDVLLSDSKKVPSERPALSCTLKTFVLGAKTFVLGALNMQLFLQVVNQLHHVGDGTAQVNGLFAGQQTTVLFR